MKGVMELIGEMDEMEREGVQRGEVADVFVLGGQSGEEQQLVVADEADGAGTGQRVVRPEFSQGSLGHDSQLVRSEVALHPLQVAHAHKADVALFLQLDVSDQLLLRLLQILHSPCL